MRIINAFLILAVLLIHWDTAAETFIPGGDIASTTWTLAGSPYRIQADVNVPIGDTLEIEPGVIVDFEGHYRLVVYGILSAEGKEGDTIRFTRVTNDLLMNPDTIGFSDTSNYNGAWSGIDLSIQYGDTTNLKYCVIEFVKTVDNKTLDRNDFLSALDVRYSSIAILENSVIRNNLVTHAPVYSRGILMVDRCLIRDNTAYENVNIIFTWACSGIKLEYNNNSRILNSEFTGNTVHGVGTAAAINLSSANALIKNNFIHNNISYKSSGVSAGGIVIRSSNPLIIQNLIVNNESYNAGAIYYQWSGGRLINNTICNNKGTVAGGINYEGSTGCIAHNNLIYGNVMGAVPEEISLQSETSQPIYKNNLIGNDISEISGSSGNPIQEAENFFGDPSLVSPTSVKGTGETSVISDWRLQESSIAINEGLKQFIDEYQVEKDIEGFRRLNYGVVDIGSSEFRMDSYTPPGTISSPEVWIADTVFITSDLITNSKLTIYPGVVICFKGNHEWYLYDTLYALGNEEAPIVFTIDDTSNFDNNSTNEGGWGPIFMYNYSRPKVFKHCIFQYGKNFDETDTRGVFRIFGGNVLFENCLFTDCYGINAAIIHSFSGADIEINSCTFNNNVVRGGSYSMIYMSGSNLHLINNLAYNNSGNGTLYLNGAHLSMVNNSMYNNDGSFYMVGTNFNFTNNTLWNNSTITFGEGDYVRIKNSILGPNVSFYNNAYNVRYCYLPPGNYQGDVANLIESSPVFRNPLSYSWSGPDSEVNAADYSLSSVSPGINGGTLDTTGLGLYALDIAGQRRINGGRIDIGAYENQGGAPHITLQPKGGLFCSGDQHQFSVDFSNSDSVLFEWTKDGVPITGATFAVLTIDSLSIHDQGNYQCRIINSFGEVLSNPVFLKVDESPDILVQPLDSWREPGRAVSFQLNYNGSGPLDFQWTLDGMAIPGGNLPEYRFTPTDSSYEGEYGCRVSNGCGIAETEPFTMYLAPQLCMVTVNEASGDNLIIWEKKTSAPVLAYNIYRESKAAGIYDLLSTMPFDDLSQFVDSVADPTVQAYLYKITAIDTAGLETDADLCLPHKTIHLLISTNPELNTTQLGWDRYYGFEYQTYFIYRSIDRENFEIIDSLASSINSWTDPNPITGTLIYRISVKKPDPCVPEVNGKKAGTGPYTHSLSNMDDNKLRTGQNIPDSVWLDNLSIMENRMPGSMVGRLHTLDQDSLDVHTYQFVTGDGDGNNGDFTILSDLLLTARSFDFEAKAEYSVRVRTLDPAQNNLEASFLIGILDEDETVGLGEIDGREFRVYPNPTSAVTMIEIPEQLCEFWRLRVYDLSGKILIEQPRLTGTSYELDCSSINKGVYFLELKGDVMYRTKLIVK